MSRLRPVLAVLVACLPAVASADAAWLQAQIRFGGETQQAELRLQWLPDSPDLLPTAAPMTGAPLLRYQREGRMTAGQWSVMGQSSAARAGGEASGEAGWISRYGWTVVGGVLITAVVVGWVLDDAFGALGESLAEEVTPDGDDPDDTPDEPDCDGITVDTGCLP